MMMIIIVIILMRMQFWIWMYRDSVHLLLRRQERRCPAFVVDKRQLASVPGWSATVMHGRDLKRSPVTSPVLKRSTAQLIYVGLKYLVL